MRYRILTLGAVLLAVISLGVFAYARDGGAGDYALAEFSVQNLSCGSCVANIQNALADTAGVGAVNVSVTTGQARTEFEPDRIDAGAIAERITRAGYPAKVRQVVSADDYRNLRRDESRLAARYVGRIGERLISRKSFAEALADREERGAALKENLLKATWQELLQRELLLFAAERNNVVVQEGEVDMELEKLRAGEGSDALVAGYGDPDAVRRELKEDLIIRRTIDEYVLKGEEDPLRRRRLLQSWYAGLVAAVPVTIFDPALKTLVEGGGGGCGGSCCG